MNKKLIIGIAIAVVVILLVIVGVSSSNKEEKIENTTNITALKESEYTSDAFASIEIGDSIADVESKVGELVEVGESSEGYDAYSYDDKELGSTYFFFFSNGKLKEVSVSYL